ncbi:bifunctional DNA-formamidopyrimidine glycosylase/DNA-(apurinic or apyrimidinic site) lyase [Mycoplasma seminis]|uniref:Bifunctional DNA-formamidopyrimidine glycosylase/DNA-(Apurinic or apyrimidinic site) lyase n=1 Tax=Mycoplasma seminis TaxID=512749 RepID=A0ABY9HBY6_9MOLU|nr:bifunctional DNA-formamidopyrimidine glycosylase/DNA-(apurinic or apyrimidinic site) lyase [Mycoplasma seminis]WLP85188.1 bifunctional DNA-formamidopyrimidine glycosylase/DNA-(apurinic or apyrimidinic site) lyase [Mycoplasma seminis]
MPEYPEVTVVTNSLNYYSQGKTIVDVKVIKEKLIKNVSVNDFINQLKGRKILSVKNYGKFIVFEFDNKLRMISHLRMSGRYYFTSWFNYISEPIWRYNNCVEFIVDTDKKEFVSSTADILIYRDPRMFGSFELISPQDDRSIYQIKNLGQLPLDTNVDELYEKLQRKNISIKSVLLDQSLVLGIGNIYADEALHKVKMYPMLKCNKVSKDRLKQLLIAAGEIMEDSIKHGGSSVHTYVSVNSKYGTFQEKLKIYGKEGKICSLCNITPIKKSKIRL